PLYDAGTTEDGSCYLVMKWIASGSLADVERRARLHSARAVTIAISAAEALHAGHRQGLLHGNIKPSNVLLDGDERACLTDFGLAMSGFPKELVPSLRPELARVCHKAIAQRISDRYTTALAQ